MGSLLLPPWTVTRYGTDGVEMRGSFSRFHQPDRLSAR
ncbi:thioesterase superfamily protein [Mycobacterium tuberculosis]|nr:thioesterase superfamily protein [Mycobacterium tuberculosis]